MYSLLYWLYCTLGYYHKKSDNKLLYHLYCCSSGLCSHYFNGIMVRIFKKSTTYGITKVKRQQKVIATLTSYPARIDTVWIAIETLLRQSVKADEVILWLADTQFPEGASSLPKELLEQTKRGLTIRFCDDLRSHKKYYYALKEFPKDILIVFDDDMFYPRNTIKTLLQIHEKAPDQIVCSSSSAFHAENIRKPIDWEQNMEGVTGAQNLGINGCSGTLYPPNSLHHNVVQIENIKKLAFYADDLWLTAAAYMQGTKFASLRYRPFPVIIKGSQRESLYTSNNSQIAEINNNTQWLAILNNYLDELRDWLKLYGIDNNTQL